MLPKNVGWFERIYGLAEDLVWEFLLSYRVRWITIRKTDMCGMQVRNKLALHSTQIFIYCDRSTVDHINPNRPPSVIRFIPIVYGDWGEEGERNPSTSRSGKERGEDFWSIVEIYNLKAVQLTIVDWGIRDVALKNWKWLITARVESRDSIGWILWLKLVWVEFEVKRGRISCENNYLKCECWLWSVA